MAKITKGLRTIDRSLIITALVLTLFARASWAAFPDDPLPLGTLKPGQTVIVEFEVTVNSPLPSGITTVTNTKVAMADGPISASSQVVTATGAVGPVPEPNAIVYLIYGLAGLVLVSFIRRRTKAGS